MINHKAIVAKTLKLYGELLTPYFPHIFHTHLTHHFLHFPLTPQMPGHPGSFMNLAGYGVSHNTPD